MHLDIVIIGTGFIGTGLIGTGLIGTTLGLALAGAGQHVIFGSRH